MERRRGLMAVGGVTLLALGAGQYLFPQDQTAEAAVVAPVALQDAAPAPAPIRVAAGTPFAAQAPGPAPAAAAPEAADAVLPVAMTQDEPPPGDALADACPVTLDAFADLGAVISFSLSAPCYPNERLVLRHGGLAVSYVTTATGSLFGDIPAMDAAGIIELRLASGATARTAVPVDDLAGMRRLAVQAMAADGLVLTGVADVRLLGDAAVPDALLAQVATVEEDTAIGIETEVTDTRCGREVMGELILSEGGVAEVTDLTLALPDCDAGGGFVVLNNPVGTLKLAAVR